MMGLQLAETEGDWFVLIMRTVYGLSLRRHELLSLTIQDTCLYFQFRSLFVSERLWQAMYVQCNTESRSCNRCCSGEQ